MKGWVKMKILVAASVLILASLGILFGVNSRKGISFDLSSTPTISPISTITPITSPIPMDEAKSIEEVIKEQIVAKRGPSASELTIKVSKNDGMYAQGGASSSGGGGMWFAAKVGNNWKLVWDGNGTILCLDLTDFPDFPTSMIPECYDQSTNKTVKR
jgi:hypothetical protein